MKCLVCKRELKNPSANGMGKVCASKNHLQGDYSSQAQISIELVYNSGRGHRNYLIKTVDRVKIFGSVNSKVSRCWCAAGKLGKCEHLIIFENADRERFPADYETNH